MRSGWLVRYVLRPPFAHQQLSFTPDARIELRLSRAFADGTSLQLNRKRKLQIGSFR